MSKRRAVKYLHLEAESGSEDYESEEVSEDLDDFRPVEIPKTKSFLQLTRELEERYRDEKDEKELGEEVLEAPSQSNLFPTSQSPLLFLVRCKVGKEREICHRIFERANDSNICSVIQKDGLKGYLYIESYKKQAVEDALSTVRNVSRHKFTVVPFKEMVDAISYKKDIAVSEFARIRSGKYRGDLVQILETFEDVVKVKAIPRIGDIKRKFDPGEYRGEAVSKDGGYYYNRDFYKDGYLEKIMLKSNLDFDVDPTFGELSELNLKESFELNENVRVIRGDLKNVVGAVESIKGNTALIRKDGKAYEVNIDDLEKSYDVGQEVSYAGENGTILSIKNRKVILGMDGFTREVECDLNDLKPAVTERKVITEAIPRLKVRRNPLLHSKAKITGGEYKGLQGTIKDAFQDKYIVNLCSGMKEVSIEKRFVQLIDQESIARITAPEEEMGDGYGGKTPSFKTPAFRTPSYRTPSGSGMASRTNYAAEEAGTEWLALSVYDGAVILSDGKEHVLSDIENGMFKTRNGELFLAHEVKYCEPEKYDRVIIMEGEDKGTTGTLVSLQNDIGMVRDSEGKTYEIEIQKITKKI